MLENGLNGTFFPEQQTLSALLTQVQLPMAISFIPCTYNHQGLTV